MVFDSLFQPKRLERRRDMLSIPNFADRLCGEIKQKKSILCCGLDPQLRYMPPHLVKEAVGRFGRSFQAIRWLFAEFNRKIIDAVADFVVCVKPQRAFYEAYGSDGDQAFVETVRYARGHGLLVIEDAKRNDGGDTADAYADGHIGEVPFFSPNDKEGVTILGRAESPTRVDCMTITPYIGEDCVVRFVARVKEFGTGIFVVTKTSFKPNSAVEQLWMFDKNSRLWQAVANMVQQWGEGTEGACGLRNVGVVMGATYPGDAVIMRQILPNSIFLIPGYGGQGASADDAVVGIREEGFGGIINNSRNLTYAWQNKKGAHQCESEKFDEAARLQAIDDRDALAEACKRAGKWPF